MKIARSNMGNRFQTYNRTRQETGYRSGLEVQIADSLTGIPYLYEEVKIPYTITSTHLYTPDFILPAQAIIIEGKGMFTTTDRQKMIMIRTQHPDLDIRMVFSNPNAKLGKRSKTTYGDWCKKHGIPCAKGTVPPEWLKHKPTAKQKKALSLFLKDLNGTKNN